MSNFTFLAAEFPAVHEAAVEAERQAAAAPGATVFFAGNSAPRRHSRCALAQRGAARKRRARNP